MHTFYYGPALSKTKALEFKSAASPATGRRTGVRVAPLWKN